MSDVVITLEQNDAQVLQSHARLRDAEAQLTRGVAAGDELRRNSTGRLIDAQGRYVREVQRTETVQRSWLSSTSSGLTGMIGQVTSLAAGYASVNALVSSYAANIRDAHDIQKQSLDTVRALGSVQSKTVQNLAGLSSKEKSEAFKTADEIQRQAGFPDRQKLAETIGTGYSAGGDLPLTINATRAAAELTRLNPEGLPDVAAGAIDASRGTGIKDARRNLSFLLQAGAQARVEDPVALGRNLAPTVLNGVNTVPTQDKQEASREVAALFSALNQFATDTKGESTKTAVVDLTSKLEEFFRELPKTQEKLDKQIRELEQKVGTEAVDEAQVKLADLDVARKKRLADAASLRPGTVADKARAELDLAIAQRAQLLEKKDDVDAARKKLAEVQQQRQALTGVQDSGTVFGRIKQFQDNTALRDALLANPFGEAAFKGGIRQVLTKGSDISKLTESNASALNFDTKEYEKTVTYQEAGTPQLRIATLEAKTRAAQQQEQVENELLQSQRQLVRNIVDKALLNTRRIGAGGALDRLNESMDSSIQPTRGTINEAAAFGQSQLANRIYAIRDQVGGLNPGDQDRLKELEAAQKRLDDLTAELVIQRTPEAIEWQRAQAEKQNAQMEKQNQLLEQINEKLSPAQDPNINAIRAQAGGG